MCEQEDFRSPGPHSGDEAEDGGDPGYGSQIVPAPNSKLLLSPWTGEAQERLDSEMPLPTESQVQTPLKTKGRPSKKAAIQVATTDAVPAAGRRRSSRGAGTRPGYYRAMHAQWAIGFCWCSGVAECKQECI